MIGMAIGFFVGILPGLGGATTLALMLPFIYNMNPTTAFAFLLGSNAVTATTGDIPRFSLEFRAKAYAPQRSSMAIPWRRTAKPAARWERH